MNHAGVRVIETDYKGYRFRSRLEARWAVFFDTLGVAWEYEREGYDLDGVWYLPDFWLPKARVFVEIKPNAATAEEEDKCMRLCQSYYGGADVLLLAGDPWEGAYDGTLYQWTETDGSAGFYTWPHAVFADCDSCDSEVWLSSSDYGARTIKNNPACTGDKWPAEHGPLVARAYQAARSARFERSRRSHRKRGDA